MGECCLMFHPWEAMQPSAPLLPRRSLPLSPQHAQQLVTCSMANQDAVDELEALESIYLDDLTGTPRARPAPARASDRTVHDAPTHYELRLLPVPDADASDNKGACAWLLACPAADIGSRPCARGSHS